MTPDPDLGAIRALGACLSAAQFDDKPRALAALDEVMSIVAYDSDERAACERLVWLCTSLAALCAETLLVARGDAHGIVYCLRRPFDELPEYEQVAITAVVACMNRDESGAAIVLRGGDTSTGLAGMADILGALVSIHTAATANTATGAQRRPED